MLQRITDYWDTLQDAIPRFANELSRLSPSAAKRKAVETRAEIIEHCRVLPDKVLLQAAVPIADHVYRAASTIGFYDASVSEYLWCSAGTFFGVLSQRGYQLQYVIDNTYDDPQRPTQLFPPWFKACGLVYACPQAVVLQLMQADGVPETNYLESLAHYIGEARYVADCLLQRCREKALHYLFLDTDSQEGSLQYAMQGQGAPGVLGMFRNEAAVPGSNVSVSFPE